MSHFTAVLDANVLHSQPVTSLLLELAVARLYRPAWSQDIHAEWRRSVLRARPDVDPTALDRRGERNLAGLRLAAGLSQRQLGERCGLGQQHVSRYEAGRHMPSLDVAHAMAKALEVDLDTFFQAWQLTAAQAAKPREGRNA